MIEFGGGQITTIESGGGRSYSGSNSCVAEAGDLTSNSAVSGLANIADNGTLRLAHGAAISTTGSLTNESFLFLSNGAQLSVAGSLTNTQTMWLDADPNKISATRRAGPISRSPAP